MDIDKAELERLKKLQYITKLRICRFEGDECLLIDTIDKFVRTSCLPCCRQQYKRMHNINEPFSSTIDEITLFTKCKPIGTTRQKDEGRPLGKRLSELDKKVPAVVGRPSGKLLTGKCRIKKHIVLGPIKDPFDDF